MNKISIVALLVTLTIFSGCWIVKPRKSAEIISSIDASELISGGTVMVHFWSTWCKPCAHELDELNALTAFANKHGIKIVGVAIDDSVSDVEKFTRLHFVNFPLTVDSAGKWKSRFRIESVPQTVFLKNGLSVIPITSRTGQRVSILKGPQPWASEFGRTTINSLLLH